MKIKVLIAVFLVLILSTALWGQGYNARQAVPGVGTPSTGDDAIWVKAASQNRCMEQCDRFYANRCDPHDADCMRQQGICVSKCLGTFR